MGPLKIMIADAHAAFRDVAKAILEPVPAVVVECDTAAAAAALYPEVRPDLLLIDVSKQTSDALRIAAGIKAAFPAARIALLSADDDPEMRAAAARVGAAALLLKDDLPTGLLRIAEALGARAGPARGKSGRAAAPARAAHPPRRGGGGRPDLGAQP